MTLRDMLFVGLLGAALVNPLQAYAEQDMETLVQEAGGGADASNPTAAVNFQIGHSARRCGGFGLGCSPV